MDLGIVDIGILFGVAAIAGCIDTIAGGGGLITLPTMLMVGVPPAAALATNKLQSTGGSLTASLYFLRQRAVRLQDNTLAIGTTFLGSILGSWLVLTLDAAALARIIPFLLILIGSYFALLPKLGAVDSQRRISSRAFAGLVAPLLGFYDGFFGPGTGMFMAVAFVGLCGYNLTRATAHTKLLNFTSNVAALLYFLLFGTIYWSVGLAMLGGQLLGAHLGAKLVFARGAQLIRPVVTIVCFVMAIKLLIEG